mgnify:CR=1 FL=1
MASEILINPSILNADFNDLENEKYQYQSQSQNYYVNKNRNVNDDLFSDNDEELNGIV